jgi:hypothetical protein
MTPKTSPDPNQLAKSIIDISNRGGTRIARERPYQAGKGWRSQGRPCKGYDAHPERRWEGREPAGARSVMKNPPV